nr:helix-turn-helix domain-containing protein [uncultured Chryseobacterium sp.]
MYLLLFFCFFGIFFSQKEHSSDYYKIKERYVNREENDDSVFPFLRQYLEKAKKEKNYILLTQGYKDAVFFSSSKEKKLIYADSTILSAQLTKNKDIISDAYLGKGIVYYFNYKKYKLALDEYLKAYQYSENTNDNYLKYRVIYHLGVVKSYLGYYNEALIHFKEAIAYFEAETQKDVHPNIIFNNKKGYYNSLHQMIVCYRNLKNYAKADSLLAIGLKETYHTNYNQERGYFLKEEGILEYRDKNYKKSLALLNESLPAINHINDFAWTTVDFFYIGKSNLEEGNIPAAIMQFQKVDSIFQKHLFILPELRENYELLIKHYKENNDIDRELYYTKQLLKADSIISKDFYYLSQKIHKEYDTQTLMREKERLGEKSFWKTFVIYGLIFLTAMLGIILIFRYKREKEIKKKYKILEEKIIKEQNIIIPDITESITATNKSGLDKKLVENILLKLKDFEEKKGFIEPGLTIIKLAQKFETNSNYLSQIINDYKGINFNRYLGELRIAYITNKLYIDKTFISYKIETLAKKCGIASRSNFSDLFYEMNGMRPTEFIKQRKLEFDKIYEK